jgi:CheY-like chemotaxis protein
MSGINAAVVMMEGLTTFSTEGVASAMCYRNKILFVEDDLFLSYILRRTLEGHGFQCENVFSLAEMQTRIEEGFEPDLVLTDLHIDTDSGCEVLAYLRSIPQFLDIPVILMSSDLKGAGVARDHKFTAFLHKNELFQDLLNSVKQHLSR